MYVILVVLYVLYCLYIHSIILVTMYIIFVYSCNLIVQYVLRFTKMDGIENDENVSRIMGIDSKIYENIIRLESKIDRLASSLNSFTTYQEKFNGTVSDDMDILKRDVNILHGFKTRVTAIISTIAFIVTIISNQIVSFFTDNRS